MVQVNFNFPASILRAFEKRQIDKMYSEMYKVAVESASNDTQIYQASQLADYMATGFGSEDNEGPGESVLSRQSRVLAYKSARIDYHLGNMMHALELYVQSRPEQRG